MKNKKYRKLQKTTINIFTFNFLYKKICFTQKYVSQRPSLYQVI